MNLGWTETKLNRIFPEAGIEDNLAVAGCSSPTTLTASSRPERLAVNIRARAETVGCAYGKPESQRIDVYHFLF
jgi:hypothetical protein